MKTYFEKCLSDFHDRAYVERATVKSAADDIIALRVGLIAEEFDELKAALLDRDTVAVAHELADLLYVVVGTADQLSIPIGQVFAEVHRANMSKLPFTKREDGKVIKGPNYRPPNVAAVLASR